VTRRLPRLIVLALSLVLSGCGFHLRGMMDMPRWLNHVAIIVEQGHRDLAPYLAEYLQSYNLIVDAEPAEAQYWIIIEHDHFQQQITSVSSSATPRQYELTYTVQFKLVRAKGEEIIPTSAISVTRQATINSDRILGSNQEESLLLDEMRRDAAVQIMNRINKNVKRETYEAIRGKQLPRN